MQPINRWLFGIPEYDESYTEHKADRIMTIQTHPDASAHFAVSCSRSTLLAHIIGVALALIEVGFGLFGLRNGEEVTMHVSGVSGFTFFGLIMDGSVSTAHLMTRGRCCCW
jgi:hypothetical protein